MNEWCGTDEDLFLLGWKIALGGIILLIFIGAISGIYPEINENKFQLIQHICDGNISRCSHISKNIITEIELKNADNEREKRE